MNPFSNMWSLTEISIEFGFLFFILLLEKSSLAAIDHRYEACAPRMCGKLNISYPFYIRGPQLQQEGFQCGFSEFEVDCSNPASPIIHVPDNDYVIDGIFYQNQSFRVHSATSINTNCLPQIGNVSEHVPISVYEASSLRLLSNCSDPVPAVLQKYRKGYCGSNDGNAKGLAMFGDDGNLKLALETCTTNVLVPVDGHENVGDDGVEDYQGLLRRGFLFNWTTLDCHECTRSGGRCGFFMNPYQFRCFCPDRPHRVSCKPRYLLLVASTFCF